MQYAPKNAVSIFGDTQDGVPSPYIPHVHPYPTRFHGPVNNIPRFGLPYRWKPRDRQFPAFPSSQCNGGPCAMNGFGAAPAMLPVVESPSFEKVTIGGAIVVALVGGAVGYALAPKGNKTKLTVGLAALAGAAAYIGERLVLAEVGCLPPPACPPRIPIPT